MASFEAYRLDKLPKFDATWHSQHRFKELKLMALFETYPLGKLMKFVLDIVNIDNGSGVAVLNMSMIIVLY